MPKFRSVNDILDYAIARELEAHDLYVHMARIIRQPELQKIVRGFALDELQHRIHLEAIKAGETDFLDDEAGSLDIAEAVAEVTPYPEMSYVELLVVAMKKEKTAFRIYTNLASLARHPAFRETLLHLAQEEAQHKLRLEIEYDWMTS
jgi:rubrerythrin